MATKRDHDGSDAENDSGEETYSMVDVLAEQKELEESASAVLGASDDKNCTYLMGYVSRQALYACTTCYKNGGKGPIGVCLACCLECHDGHELVELYTKRNFRCDCGNSKFQKGFECKLMNKKQPLNHDNVYNQNFEGKYCTCERPYPDPEDNTEDEMIQCTVCEDWYHGRHLGSKAPPDFSEMVCDSCMMRLGFLWPYRLPNESVTVDDECLYDVLKKQMSEAEKIVAGFFSKEWRSRLCRCAKCSTMYDEAKVAFLTDENDSVTAYEERGRLEGKSQYDKGMEELSKMDRTKQVELMQDYHDMKTELKDYLEGFASSGKVVTKDDISQFFETMKGRKRQRVEIPLNCR